MSLHIDPKAMNTFAGRAMDHAYELRAVHLKLDLPSDALGSFGEATALTAKLVAHTDDVNNRVNATATALSALAHAAAQAAALAGSTDADIAKGMKAVNHSVDDARRALKPTAP